MTNKAIPGLTAATTPLAGTETLPVYQGGATVKIAVSDLTAGRNVSMADLTTTGNTVLGDAATDTLNVGAGGLVKDASGNVGIGIAGPATRLDIAGISPVVRIRDTQNKTPWVIGDLVGGIEIYSNDTSAPGAKVVSSIKAVADVSSNAASGALVFSTSTAAGIVTEQLRVSSAGNVTIATGNFIQGTAAKGINFTANTPAAGMTSQLLNWYEEGTWTPNQGAGLTLVGAFSSSGTYTRIGRQVTVRGQVVGATSVATTVAGVISSNLPFTAAVTHAGSMFNSAVNASGVVQVTSASVVAATTIAATPNITFTATYTV